MKMLHSTTLFAFLISILKSTHHCMCTGFLGNIQHVVPVYFKETSLKFPNILKEERLIKVDMLIKGLHDKL